jgi:hypothetical protein
VFHDELRRRIKTRRVGSTRRAAKKKTVGSPARDASARFSLVKRKKNTTPNGVVASGRVVASVDMCIVDLTVYRHNSLNSEGGACFQVTISRHVRRTRRGVETRVSIAKKKARLDGATDPWGLERGLRAFLDRD